MATHKVFRSGNWNPPTAGDVLKLLTGIDASLRGLQLRDLGDLNGHRLRQVWGAVTEVAEIKKNISGPSLVAVSKFLHFWNPRLFMIVDREVMRNWVFEHGWLRDQIQEISDSLSDRLPPKVSQHEHFRTDLRWLLAVLAWAGRVLHFNKGIGDGFARYIRHYATVPVPEDIATYDAAAMEWLLLGLVQLPPAGVSFPLGDPEDV